MTLQQLRYIIALDKERHFARAAEVCFVSQPGLTLQLKALEEEIGIKIFDRSVVPLKPTELGEVIIAKAKKVIQEAEGIRNFVIDEKNTLEGDIRLGIISTLAPYLMPLLITKIKTYLPNVNLIIKESPTILLMHELEKGDVDIAIMSTPTGNKALREFPVFYESFVAFLHKSHSLATADFFTLSDADKNRLLLLHTEYCFNAQLLDLCHLKNENQIEQKFSYAITSIETLKNLVRSDLGLAIIPELSVMYETNPDSCYKHFENPQPVREISLVVTDTFSKKLLLEKLKEALLECLPEKLKKNFNHKRISWDDSPYFRKIAEQVYKKIGKIH